jgi:hypothetical protein
MFYFRKSRGTTSPKVALRRGPTTALKWIRASPTLFVLFTASRGRLISLCTKGLPRKKTYTDSFINFTTVGHPGNQRKTRLKLEDETYINASVQGEVDVAYPGYGCFLLDTKIYNFKERITFALKNQCSLMFSITYKMTNCTDNSSCDIGTKL